MRSAAFWGGETTRSQQSYDHNRADNSTSRVFGNAFEPEELSPRNMGQARLLVRGTPGWLTRWTRWSGRTSSTSSAGPANHHHHRRE